MKKTVLKLVLTALVAGMSVPLAVHAADEDLQMKIDKLSQEVADLKGSVQKVEDKSIGRWLTIGGDYRFRVDSMHGQTVTYSDAIGTMFNLVNGFTAPVTGLPGSGVAGATIGGLTSLTPTQFIMQGQAGTLFTPAQFDTMLTQYMP